MEYSRRDPPPSYDSVVRRTNTSRSQKNKQANDNTTNDDHDVSSDTQLQQQASSLSVDKDGADTCEKPNLHGDDLLNTNEEDIVRERQPECCSKQQPGTSTQNSIRERELECAPTGLWARFKKSLEELALFIIQILD